VALCSFTAVPALARTAGPSIHLATVHGLPMKTHMKSTPRESISHFTQTETFSASLSVATYLKHKVTLLGDTWYLTSSCTQPTKEKWVGLPKKTLYAKVSQSTSTGTITACPGTTFTFHDIDYDLTSKKTKSGDADVVSGNLIANKFDGYDLKLIATIDITFTK
jgi:hypothetical protein